MGCHWRTWVQPLCVLSHRYKFILITKDLQDWDQLIAKVIDFNVLRRLSMLSVTIPDQPEQMRRVLQLSGASDLRELSLFRVTSAHWPLMHNFVSGLAQQHGSSLTKLAVMKILLPTSVLHLLCHGCPNISSLFFVGEQGKLVSLEHKCGFVQHSHIHKSRTKFRVPFPIFSISVLCISTSL